MKEVWKQLTTTLSVVVIAMAAFWLVEAREYVTRGEMSQNLEKVVLGLHDELADERAVTVALALTLDANTKAINDLRVVLARLEGKLQPFDLSGGNP
jgi:hypothetical protein